MQDQVLDPAGARALCDLTSELAVASSASGMAGAIAETAHGIVGAAYAQLGLPSPRGDALVLYHGDDLDDRAQAEWPTVPIDADTPVSRVMASGRALTFGSAAELTDEFPLVRAASEASGYQSLVVVPIVDPLRRDRSAGTLSVAWEERDRADRRSLEIMTSVARRCALALARVDRSTTGTAGTARTANGPVGRSEVLALQQSLLPSIRIRHPRLEVASRYVSSGDDLVVGGDWYDTLPLPDGRVAFVIGDVAGHGWEAALAMGQIRNDVEALAAHHRRPDELLAEIDRYAGDRGAPMTTAAVVYVDPARSEATCTVAGHPPPIHVRDGAHVLAHSLGPPLGSGLTGRSWPRSAVTRIGRDETLVLYTDGLVERRDETLDDGIGRLRELVATRAALGPDALCDSVMEAMIGRGDPADDVALLVVRLR